MTDLVTAPPYGIVRWRCSPTQVIAEPLAGNFRADSFSLPTTLAFYEVDRDGTNRASDVLALIEEGDRLVVQQYDQANRYQAYDVGVAVDNGTWWTLPIATVVGTTASLSSNKDYVFVFRHPEVSDDPVGEETTYTVTPPAFLVPTSQLADLVDELVTALTAEVRADPVRDADKLDRASRTAIRDVEIHLDHPGGPNNPPVYSTAAEVDSQVFDALVTVGASYLKRPGFAYGTVGYDEPDPLAVRARGAALAALTTGHKARFGVG